MTSDGVRWMSRMTAATTFANPVNGLEEAPGTSLPASTHQQVTFARPPHRTLPNKLGAWMDSQLMTSRTLAAALELWSFAELTLYWVFFCALLKVAFTELSPGTAWTPGSFLASTPALKGPVYALLFFLAGTPTLALCPPHHSDLELSEWLGLRMTGRLCREDDPVPG